MLSVLAKISSALIVFTALCFCYQIAYLFVPLIVKRKLKKEPKNNRYAILIAARNEEAVIPHLIDSIKAQDYPSELIDIFVIADNCTDNTVAVARQHGATVFTRFNKVKVGKGYALNYLIEQIKQNDDISRFDDFLIFDADNLLKPDYITQINRLPSEGYQAFCGFRNTKNFGTNWITSGYALWYLHESTHMNRSRMAIGSSAAVNGTGFGFTRELLEKMGGWNFFTLTEDIEFNNWCSVNGIKIGYCHKAMIFDEQPLTFRQSWRQRTRWAQGGFQVSCKYVGKLFKNLFHGGWVSYSCFELLTLSLCGLTLSTVTGILSAVVLFLGTNMTAFAILITSFFLGAYLSMFAIGAWTVVLEWKQIVATPWEKVRSLFSFPFFMMTFLPISICAMFQKFYWSPIEHTVAISAKQLEQQKQ